MLLWKMELGESAAGKQRWREVVEIAPEGLTANERTIKGLEMSMYYTFDIGNFGLSDSSVVCYNKTARMGNLAPLDFCDRLIDLRMEDAVLIIEEMERSSVLRRGCR